MAGEIVAEFTSAPSIRNRIDLAGNVRTQEQRRM
jgi:hypothetical protein